MLVKHISEGDMIPRFYGIAWRDWSRNKAVCLPLGVNLIAAAVRGVFISFMQGSKAVASNPRDAYHQGLAAGIELSFERASLQAGDTLLVSSASKLTPAQMEAVQAQVKRVLPPGVKGLIVVPGLGVEVIPAGAAVPAP